MIIPGIDSITYGRRVIQAAIDRYEHMSLAADNAGNPERAERHRGRAAVMRRELLGQGGCVIAPFDERWLDPEFRAQMTRARAQVLAQRGEAAMSKKPTAQQRDTRNTANRDARVRQTLAHGHRQAGDERAAKFQEEAAAKHAAKAVEAQRAIDRAEGEPK